MSIFVRARFDVLDGREADFEKLAIALADQAATEPGTRTYRWFPDGPSSYLVLEEYTDDEAAMAHNERAADLLSKVSQCATLAFAELYGPIGPGTRSWAETTPGVTTYPDFTT